MSALILPNKNISQLAEVDSSINEIMDKIDSVIKSIPGIGNLNGAWQTTLVNKTFKDYYDLTISQGRRHYNALGHVAFKLVCVIHKMMTDNVEFNSA